MSPVGNNIKNVNKVDLVYNQWLLHRNIILEFVKSTNVLTMCDVEYMIESMCIK